MLRPSSPPHPWWHCHPCLLEALRELPNRRASGCRFRLMSFSRAIRMVASTPSAAGRTVFAFGTLRCGPHLSKCFMLRGTCTRGVLRSRCTVNSMRFCVTRRVVKLTKRCIRFDTMQPWGQRNAPILRAARRRHGFTALQSGRASGRHAPLRTPPRQHPHIITGRRIRCHVFQRRQNGAQRLGTKSPRASSRSSRRSTCWGAPSTHCGRSLAAELQRRVCLELDYGSVDSVPPSSAEPGARSSIACL